MLTPTQEEEWLAAEVADGACNGGAEALFQAAGLAVSGHVEPPQGCGAGAAEGVALELVAASGGPPVARATADASGAFRMGPVAAGAFLLRPAGGEDGWAVASAAVAASAAAVEVEGGLAMSGLAVGGSVLAGGKGLAGAELRLEQEGRAPLLARSALDGAFHFAGVACGPFRVEAATAAELRLTPALLEGSLATGGAQLPPFSVAAFAVEGRVVDLAGAAVAGAELLADGSAVATTDAEGNYRWLAPLATVRLQARAPALRWAAVSLSLSPQAATLAPLSAVVASVSGAVEEGGGRRVSLSPRDSAARAALATHADLALLSASADANGEFELWAAAGAWAAEVEASAADVAAGLRFEPSTADVDVAGPVRGLRFSRSALGISGSVACDGPCVGVTLTLERRSDGATREATAAADGAFSFAGLLPGLHDVRVSGAGRCWTPAVQTVEAAAEAAAAPAFEQGGWAAPLLLPRAMALRASPAAGGPALGHEAAAGASRLCLPTAGEYLLEAEGLRFAAPLRFHTATAAAEALAPVVAEAELRATVLLPPSAAALARTVTLALVGGEGGEEVVAQAAAAPLEDGGVRLSFLVWTAADGGGLRLEARAEELLFEPSSLAAASLAAAAASATRQLEPFAATLGEFLAGVVEPPLAGVELRVHGPDRRLLAASRTDSSGAYRVGPLPAGVAYTTEALAEGFSFAACEGGFRAQRLGGLRLTVADEAGAPLAGVLLSLTGASSFRLNKETADDGAAEAADLAPGAYHLRPLLKEYAFEPASASLEVREGEQASLALVARRVSYSAFGSVRSLAGAGERLLAIEALAEDGRREEAQTDAGGAYRLRGLAPGVRYVVRPAECARVAAFVPPARALLMAEADAEALSFLALRAPSRLDVSGAVVAPAEHLASLTVRLITAGGEEVASAALAAVPLFSFTGLAKGAYRLEVTSSLSPAIFAVAPVSVAVAETVGAAWVDVAFPVQDRALAAVEQSGAASFLLLLLLSAAAAAAYYHKEVLALSARFRGAAAAPASAAANDYIPAEQRRRAQRKQKRTHK